MKTIYIDDDYRCHVSNSDGIFREVETDVFDGKCDVFIEAYRYVPDGESWTREDGEKFDGCMISPVIDYNDIAQIQKDYENTTRLAALEEETALLKEENAVLKEENNMMMECLLEMSSIVYA